MLPTPPGWPDVIPGLPILFVFTGAPGAFDHARQQKAAGFVNHVALASPQQAHRYHWPTRGLSVIVILFGHSDAQAEQQLVALLLLDDPVEVLVRHWPSLTVVRSVP